MTKSVKNLIKMVLIVAIFYFIFRQLYENLAMLKLERISFGWIDCCLSIFLCMSGEYCFSAGWYRIICRHGLSGQFATSNYYWVLSGAGKYIPGRIWQFAGRLYFFERIGVKRKEVISCSIIEQFYLLASCLFIFSLCIILSPEAYSGFLPAKLKYVSLLITVVTVLFIHPKILNGSVEILSKVIKPLAFRSNSTFNEALILFAVYSVGWVMMSAGFFFLVRALVDVGADSVLYLASVNAGAYFIGYLTVVTPGGLGVREGVITYMLNFVFTVGMGAMISLLTRVWWICCELLYLVTSMLIYRFVTSTSKDAYRAVGSTRV
jgi:hypothetical protein